MATVFSIMWFAFFIGKPNPMAYFFSNTISSSSTWWSTYINLNRSYNRSRRSSKLFEGVMGYLLDFFITSLYSSLVISSFRANRSNKPFSLGLISPSTAARDAKEEIDAWQHLIDTGVCWRLQGWFGRTAQSLIESGMCKEKTIN